MQKEIRDILEVVIFMRDRMVTKEELSEGLNSLRVELKADIARVEQHLIGHENRMGAIDNRIDGEVFARRDLENRVRTVLPALPQVAA